MSKRSLAGDKVTIKIPKSLYEKISRVIDGTGYNSVTDFIVYVMRDLMSSHSEIERGTYTQEELAEIKKRLENLGYM